MYAMFKSLQCAEAEGEAAGGETFPRLKVAKTIDCRGDVQLKLFDTS